MSSLTGLGGFFSDPHRLFYELGLWNDAPAALKPNQITLALREGLSSPQTSPRFMLIFQRDIPSFVALSSAPWNKFRRTFTFGTRLSDYNDKRG